MAWMNQERKRELVEAAKPVLRRYGMKASFRTDRHSITCTLKSGPIDFFADRLTKAVNGFSPHTESITAEDFYSRSPDVNHFWIDHHWTGAARMFLEELQAALDTGNHDRSDAMVDYFDVGWYTHINIGTYKKHYEVTKGTHQWSQGERFNPVTLEEAPWHSRWVSSQNPHRSNGEAWKPQWVLERIGTPWSCSVGSETYWAS